jgi:hypothetical protein
MKSRTAANVKTNSLQLRHGYITTESVGADKMDFNSGSGLHRHVPFSDPAFPLCDIIYELKTSAWRRWHI